MLHVLTFLSALFGGEIPVVAFAVGQDSLCAFLLPQNVQFHAVHVRVMAFPADAGVVELPLDDHSFVARWVLGAAGT